MRAQAMGCVGDGSSATIAPLSVADELLAACRAPLLMDE